MIKNEENQIAGFWKNPGKAELIFGFHKALFCWCDAGEKLLQFSY